MKISPVIDNDTLRIDPKTGEMYVIDQRVAIASSVRWIIGVKTGERKYILASEWDEWETVQITIDLEMPEKAAIPPAPSIGGDSYDVAAWLRDAGAKDLASAFEDANPETKE